MQNWPQPGVPSRRPHCARQSKDLVQRAFGVRHGLQLVLDAQVGAQPGRGHRARGQAGDAGELHHVVFLRLGQHALELGVGVALGRDGEGRAQLHRGGAQRLHARDVLAAADAAGGDQRDLALDARRAQEGQRLRDHVLEVEARVVQVGDARRAQVAAGQPRVLDDDGVGQALLAFPLLHDQLHAAGVAEDRDQRRVRVVLRQVGQVQRQAGAHDDGVDAGFQRAPAPRPRRR